jgi:hypothetical protein
MYMIRELRCRSPYQVPAEYMDLYTAQRDDIYSQVHIRYWLILSYISDIVKYMFMLAYTVYTCYILLQAYMPSCFFACMLM